MTDEQKANIDKALANASLSKDISSASDVSGKPAPNDPTAIDQAKDVGQDLHKQGVTMDK